MLSSKTGSRQVIQLRDNPFIPFPPFFQKGGEGVYLDLITGSIMAEEKNLDELRITRRSFLKATAATAGAISLGHSLFDFKNWAETNAEAPVTRIPTICNGCG